MKKFTLFALLLAAIQLNSKAEVVTAQKAAQVAENFFLPATKGSGGPLELVWDGETEATRAAAAAPAFYVFARGGGGFVIVSGESSVNPILAYSYSGKFTREGMPDNLEAWFDELRENVNSRRGLPSSAEVAGKWERLGERTRAAGDTIPSRLLYNTAKWGQDYPFNILCPIDHMYERVSKLGCTAVSFAQLLYYWKWPDKGVGKLGSYWANDRHYVAPEIILGHEYQWDKMLDNYVDVPHTPEQDTAVAVFCRDVAQGGMTIFGATGASGDQTKFLQRLTDPMKLTRKCRRMFRVHYTAKDWIRVLQEGMQSGPVYYCLFHEDGGHSVITDGYDADGLIHFNWGFYGMNDGYYDVTVENLNGAMYYPKTHSCYVGVGPRTDDEIQEGMLYFGNGVKGGVNVTSGSPASGGEFEVSLVNVYSGCPFDFNPECVIAHVDREFRIKNAVSETFRMSDSTIHSSTYLTRTGVKCRLTEPIEWGDAVAMFYRAFEGDTAWSLTRYSVQSDAKIIYGVYRLTDEKSVAQTASLSFDAALGRYLITHTPEATCRILAPDGTPIEGLGINEGRCTVEVSKLAPGRNRVVISHKSYKDVKEFDIIVK